MSKKMALYAPVLNHIWNYLADKDQDPERLFHEAGIAPGLKSAIPLPKRGQQVSAGLDLFLQSNKPIGKLGGARQSGKHFVAAGVNINVKHALQMLCVSFACISAALLCAVLHTRHRTPR